MVLRVFFVQREVVRRGAGNALSALLLGRPFQRAAYSTVVITTH